MSAPETPPIPSAPMPVKRPAYEPAARLLRPTGYDPDMARPITTVAGAVLILLRVLAGILVLVALASGWDSLALDLELGADGSQLTPEIRRFTLVVVLIIGAIVLLADLLLAVFTLRGHNWSRVIVMIISVFSISTSFTAWWVQGQEITLDSTYLSLSLDILILLALSSRSAAAYARRKERR
ncbi:hypothetical protein [Microbacterium pygmaeum]|uniref:Uncharacterized protein n=1 Tax=Microbacterium pygmaeum TaxID=370764 RepID=A0A1G7VRQ7_9MICO|nr:hypothetical protein [Microbacterium pygmaeum]SDG62228.1 hypothetical protein SAMN04489810_0800 [Microbacterium pygmaeum]